MFNLQYGTLYVVATPIGNKDDITIRALEVLKSVDCIFAEDTRHSSIFLKNFNINKPIISLHAHNENQKSKNLIQKLLDGLNCALISDAGTPLISDPGFPLVKTARENNISVVPVPGACALIAALCVAGVSTDEFKFLGFLPSNKSQRQEKLKNLINYEHSVIFYESTHRIINCLQDICKIFGENKIIVLAKELTKNFETIISDNVKNIILWLEEDVNRVKGEFVVILKASEEIPNADLQIIEAQKLLIALLAEIPLKQAVNIASKVVNIKKNVLYKMAIELIGKLCD